MAHHARVEEAKLTGRGRPSMAGLDNYQLQLRIDPPEIVSVAGYHSLPGSLRTNGDVGIDDVGRPGSCQQQAYGRRVWSIQRNKVRTNLSN